MDGNIIFSYNIDPGWEIVKKIRDKVEAFVTPINNDVGYASKMTTSELIENAVKYGCSVDKEKGISFNLTMDEGEIKIKVSNGVKSPIDYENVAYHIDKINASDDCQALYVERLTELMDNKRPGASRLGLYRIAFEGEFHLHYEYEDSVLTIIASRVLE